MSPARQLTWHPGEMARASILLQETVAQPVRKTSRFLAATNNVPGAGQPQIGWLRLCPWHLARRSLTSWLSERIG